MFYKHVNISKMSMYMIFNLKNRLDFIYIYKSHVKLHFLYIKVYVCLVNIITYLFVKCK